MSIREQLPHIRDNYDLGELHESQIAKSPVIQFEKWFEEALMAEISEVNAMTLATVFSQQPTIRVVLLKGLDEKGFVFFTNYESRKAQEIAGNPKAAVNFFWKELHRQIRIEGRIEKISFEESNTYYQSRDRGSRIGAWASPQSQVIENREELEDRVNEFTQKYEGKEEIPCPEHWGGYRLVPHYFEFWQGRPSRLHDRIVYEKEGNVWKIQRLA
ncbi:MAG: pyridoxamine 5'-phosphate oxidase, partial [Bacteroidetes bacterium]|nr:pyridoxamine 5'-phosphate oxidase [Bacteroidota bacterium]